jgi:hypothetical protein
MHLVNVALITVVRKTQMTEELICSVLWHYTPVRPETSHHLSMYVLFLDLRYSVCVCVCVCVCARARARVCVLGHSIGIRETWTLESCLIK